MSTEHLKEIVRYLQHAEFGKRSAEELLSVSKICIALNDMVTVCAPDMAYGDRRFYEKRASELFAILKNKCGRCGDLSLRCRMIDVMYALACQVAVVADPKKLNACYAATEALLEHEAGSGGDNPEHAGIYICIADYLYPYPDSSCELLQRLKRQIAAWVAELTPDAGWRGLAFDRALGRIRIMSMNSYMFLDNTYDSAIKQAYAYYVGRIVIPEDIYTCRLDSLLTLRLMYEAVAQYNIMEIPVDRKKMYRIAELMFRKSQILPLDSEEWLCCISCVAHCLSDVMIEQAQNEAMAFTA